MSKVINHDTTYLIKDTPFVIIGGYSSFSSALYLLTYWEKKLLTPKYKTKNSVYCFSAPLSDKYSEQEVKFWSSAHQKKEISCFLPNRIFHSLLLPYQWIFQSKAYPSHDLPFVCSAKSVQRQANCPLVVSLVSLSSDPDEQKN